MTTRFRIPLAAAIVAGLTIGWVDTRPTWDDTGITVGLTLLSSAAIGAAVSRRAWIAALGVAKE
jgi:hypothetical protein